MNAPSGTAGPPDVEPAGRLEHLDRVLERFEDFCTVTAGVRAAIPVHVEVCDSTGRKLR